MWLRRSFPPRLASPTSSSAHIAVSAAPYVDRDEAPVERRHASRRTLESPTKYDAIPKGTCERCGLVVPYRERIWEDVSDADETKLLVSRDFKEGTVGWRMAHFTLSELATPIRSKVRR